MRPFKVLDQTISWCGHKSKETVQCNHIFNFWDVWGDLYRAANHWRLSEAPRCCRISPVKGGPWSVNRAEVQWLTRGIPLVINHRTGQPQTSCSEVDRSGLLNYNTSLTLSILLSTLFLWFLSYHCFFIFLIVTFLCTLYCILIDETCCMDTFWLID